MSASKHRFYHRLQLAAHRLQKMADRDVIASSGLTTAQAAVLNIVSNRKETTQKDVADKLGLNESAITAMVNRLVRMEFLERVRSERDLRVWQLQLTEEGKSSLQKTKAPFKRINKVVDDVLSDEDVEKAVECLERLIDKLRE